MLRRLEHRARDIDRNPEPEQRAYRFQRSRVNRAIVFVDTDKRLDCWQGLKHSPADPDAPVSGGNYGRWL